MNGLAIPPCLQDGRQLRSLVHQVREFIEDKSKAACPLLAPLCLLRSVAQKSVPRNSNILRGDSFTRKGCDQLPGEHEPLCSGSGLLRKKVAVWLFVLVSVYASREVALQEECLAQPPASVQEQHLPTGPVALPCAVQGCEFELPIIKRIWLDGHGRHRRGCR